MSLLASARLFGAPLQIRSDGDEPLTTVSSPRPAGDAGITVRPREGMGAPEPAILFGILDRCRKLAGENTNGSVAACNAAGYITPAIARGATITRTPAMVAKTKRAFLFLGEFLARCKQSQNEAGIFLPDPIDRVK